MCHVPCALCLVPCGERFSCARKKSRLLNRRPFGLLMILLLSYEDDLLSVDHQSELVAVVQANFALDRLAFSVFHA